MESAKFPMILLTAGDSEIIREYSIELIDRGRDKLYRFQEGQKRLNAKHDIPLYESNIFLFNRNAIMQFFMYKLFRESHIEWIELRIHDMDGYDLPYLEMFTRVDKEKFQRILDQFLEIQMGIFYN